MGNLFYFLIAALSAVGFVIAYNISRKKKAKQPLVCPLKFHCDPVVHSEYSTLFHIPLEFFGMAYYALVFSSYVAFAIFPDFTVYRFYVMGIAAMTAFAFFFSLYLTAIQAFVIKQWCSWCLMSAGLCTFIFLLVIQTSFLDVIPYIKNYFPFILGLHLLGVVIGFGGALITDMFFGKFLRDLRITNEEAGNLKTFSHIIWTGLVIIIVSGSLMFLSDVEHYSQSAKFLAKMLVVGVIIVNGFFLNIVITPKLTSISFGELISSEDKKMREFRSLAFASGAISATSWWTAFILGMIQVSPAPLFTLLSVYFMLLTGAVIFSQLLEKMISRRKTSASPDVV